MLPVRPQHKGGCVGSGIGAAAVDEDQLCPAVRLSPAVALVGFHGGLWKREWEGNVAVWKTLGKAKRAQRKLFKPPQLLAPLAEGSPCTRSWSGSGSEQAPGQNLPTAVMALKTHQIQ